MIIVALVVMTLLLIFLTGRFRAGGEAVSQIAPGDIEIARSACQLACDKANLATTSKEQCADWKNIFCDKSVRVGRESTVTCGTPREDATAATSTNLFVVTCPSPYSAEGCSCS